MNLLPQSSIWADGEEEAEAKGDREEEKKERSPDHSSFITTSLSSSSTGFFVFLPFFPGVYIHLTKSRCVSTSS